MFGKHLQIYVLSLLLMILPLAQWAQAADPPRDLGRGEGGIRQPEMQLTFSMDHTNIDIHRMSDSAGFEALIHGIVACTTPVIWSLSPSPYRAYGPADLLQVNNIMGNPVQQGSASVPLQWNLSVNGGPFLPMESTSDYRMIWRFMPGMYAYTLRITGLPLRYQPAGYYHLRMSQSFVPQL